MSAFDMGWIWAPSSSFEWSSGEKAVVNGNQTLANAIGDFAKIARP